MPKLKPNTWFALGALVTGLGVAAGAFGAHYLKSRITSELLATFKTGVTYHFYHGFALIAVGWAASKWTHPRIHTAGWSFLIGILLFSGSLYLLALTEIKILGMVAALGGVAFLVGWGLLAFAAWRSQH
jgi:uncharacterized membrane protein YgdD (TMEM256/DUF423 family)